MSKLILGTPYNKARVYGISDKKDKDIPKCEKGDILKLFGENTLVIQPKHAHREEILELKRKIHELGFKYSQRKADNSEMPFIIIKNISPENENTTKLIKYLTNKYWDFEYNSAEYHTKSVEDNNNYCGNCGRYCENLEYSPVYNDYVCAVCMTGEGEEDVFNNGGVAENYKKELSDLTAKIFDEKYRDNTIQEEDDDIFEENWNKAKKEAIEKLKEKYKGKIVNEDYLENLIEEPEHLWASWNVAQRRHFLYDHEGEDTSHLWQQMINWDYEDLPNVIKNNIKHHLIERYDKGGTIEVDSLGNPVNKKDIEKMEKFIEQEIPKLDDKRYFTEGMKRKEAKRRYYEKNKLGAYHSMFDDLFD